MKGLPHWACSSVWIKSRWVTSFYHFIKLVISLLLRSLLGKGFSSTESSDRGSPLCGRSAQRQQITYKIIVRAGTPQQDRIQCLHLTKACPRRPLGGVANSNRRYPFLGPTPRKLAWRPTRCIYYVTTEYIKAHNVCVSLACGFKFVVPLPYLPFRTWYSYISFSMYSFLFNN